MAVFIPDLFTGYINGREAAIKSNWNDQTNFNTVLKGQLQNAFDMQTFDDAAAIARNNRNNSNANAARYGLETDLELQRGMAALENGIPQLQGQVSRMALETRRAELQREMDLINGQLSSMPPDQGQGAQATGQTQGTGFDMSKVPIVNTPDPINQGGAATWLNTGGTGAWPNAINPPAQRGYSVTQSSNVVPPTSLNATPVQGFGIAPSGQKFREVSDAERYNDERMNMG